MPMLEFKIAFLKVSDIYRAIILILFITQPRVKQVMVASIRLHRYQKVGDLFQMVILYDISTRTTYIVESFDSHCHKSLSLLT